MTVHPTFQGDDASLPGMPAAPAGAARPERLLIALTQDPSLCGALQDLAVDDIAVSIVATLNDLTDELLQHTAAAALIDAASLGGPVIPVVDTLARQFPDLRLLIAGHGTEQQLLTSRIANQTVFRFVHKPASPQRLKLFLDAAARPQHGAATAAPTPLRQEPPARVSAGGTGASRNAAIAGALVLLLAAGTWMFWPERQAPAAAGAASLQNSSAIASLLEQADQALAEGVLVATDGRSAAEIYRHVSALDPANTAARAGYERAIEAAVRSVEESLLAGRLEEAGLLAGNIRRIAPTNPRLDFLDAQLARELERANADTAQRQAYELRQTQIRAALGKMTGRMNAGALLAPADSSAIAAFREAEAISMNDPAVRVARESLLATLLTAADTELLAGRAAAANRLVDAAASINRNAPGLDVLRRRINDTSATAVAAVPIAPPARSENPSLPAAAFTPPAGATPAVSAEPSVAPAAAAPPEVAAAPVPAGSLRALRRPDPVYPRRALEQLVSGWVEMEFTVGTDGSVQDIMVRNAEPAGVFESAATGALSRYRYAPVLRDGQPVTQRAYLRMRFTAQDAR